MLFGKTKVALALAIGLGLACPRLSAAADSDCHNPDALGVSRVQEVDTSGGPIFGSIQYTHAPTFLADKEVVLTFDDGPFPETTPAILDALAEQCTKATFFYVGRMALKNPDILAKVDAAGETIGAHTWSHADLRKLAGPRAQAEIERGVSLLEARLGHPIAPFFRYPYLSDPKAISKYLGDRNFAIFSADVDSWDSHGLTPTAHIINYVMTRLKEHGRGIVLMHDIKHTTAAALPEILKQLKAGGFKIVHLVPKAPATSLAPYDAWARDTIDQNDNAALVAANTKPATAVKLAAVKTDAVKMDGKKLALAAASQTGKATFAALTIGATLKSQDLIGATSASARLTSGPAPAGDASAPAPRLAIVVAANETQEPAVPSAPVATAAAAKPVGETIGTLEPAVAPALDPAATAVRAVTTVDAQPALGSPAPSGAKVAAVRRQSGTAPAAPAENPADLTVLSPAAKTVTSAADVPAGEAARPETGGASAATKPAAPIVMAQLTQSPATPDEAPAAARQSPDAAGSSASPGEAMPADVTAQAQAKPLPSQDASDGPTPVFVAANTVLAPSALRPHTSGALDVVDGLASEANAAPMASAIDTDPAAGAGRNTRKQAEAIVQALAPAQASGNAGAATAAPLRVAETLDPAAEPAEAILEPSPAQGSTPSKPRDSHTPFREVAVLSPRPADLATADSLPATLTRTIAAGGEGSLAKLDPAAGLAPGVSDTAAAQAPDLRSSQTLVVASAEIATQSAPQGAEDGATARSDSVVTPKSPMDAPLLGAANSPASSGQDTRQSEAATVVTSPSVSGAPPANSPQTSGTRTSTPEAAGSGGEPVAATSQDASATPSAGGKRPAAMRDQPVVAALEPSPVIASASAPAITTPATDLSASATANVVGASGRILRKHAVAASAPDASAQAQKPVATDGPIVKKPATHPVAQAVLSPPPAAAATVAAAPTLATDSGTQAPATVAKKKLALKPLKAAKTTVVWLQSNGGGSGSGNSANFTTLPLSKK